MPSAITATPGEAVRNTQTAILAALGSLGQHHTSQSDDTSAGLSIADGGGGTTEDSVGTGAENGDTPPFRRRDRW